MLLVPRSLLRSAARVIVPVVGLLGTALAANAQNAPDTKANWILADKFTNQQREDLKAFIRAL